MKLNGVHCSKDVKLIKLISTDLLFFFFCSVDTQPPTEHFQTVLHKPPTQTLIDFPNNWADSLSKRLTAKQCCKHILTNSC